MPRRLLLLAAAALLPLSAALVARSALITPVLPGARRSIAPLTAKKAGGGGFGAAPREKTAAPQKPLKTLVGECRKKWALWRDDQAADVWIAAREGKRWFLAGRVCCAPTASLAGAVQAQKAIIFKLGATLDPSLMQAPSGLIAATAAEGTADAVEGGAPLALVPRDAAVPDDAGSYGYEPTIYKPTDRIITAEATAA